MRKKVMFFSGTYFCFSNSKYNNEKTHHYASYDWSEAAFPQVWPHGAVFDILNMAKDAEYNS